MFLNYAVKVQGQWQGVLWHIPLISVIFKYCWPALKSSTNKSKFTQSRRITNAYSKILYCLNKNNQQYSSKFLYQTWLPPHLTREVFLYWLFIKILDKWYYKYFWILKAWVSSSIYTTSFHKRNPITIWCVNGYCSSLFGYSILRHLPIKNEHRAHYLMYLCVETQMQIWFCITCSFLNYYLFS